MSRTEELIPSTPFNIASRDLDCARVFAIDVLRCDRCGSRMQRVEWVTRQAAALGVSRSTIHRKIEELQINLDEILGEQSLHLDR